jgi:hypothetical protein
MREMAYSMVCMQVTMQSSVRLHILVVMAYCILQCHAALNLDVNPMSATTLLEFTCLLLLCTGLPAVGNRWWEQAMRRRFEEWQVHRKPMK